MEAALIVTALAALAGGWLYARLLRRANYLREANAYLRDENDRLRAELARATEG